MKLTLGWLKEHLQTDLDLTALSERLTALGLEVEGIEDPGAALAAFTVARIAEAVPHPNADRLRLCTVETGTDRLSVVCGAPNARAGLVTVLARPGVTIPATGKVLEAGQIRGVVSEGMLCSARELGLGDEHDGIMELPAETPVGLSFAKVAGLDDPVIELALTPNRGDCAGVRGIARDLAAAGAGTLKPLAVPKVPSAFESPVGMTIQDEAACPLFVARTIRGVKNGPSPAWLQRRLTAVGLRPISALVDVTNWFTIAYARPLHVFDRAKLKGDLVVRAAHAGETLEALNGKSYALEPGMTVVADQAGPQGLGGVMGGVASGVGPDTTEIVLEIALFDPVRTALTGRALQIASDARYRFERGVDPGFVLDAVELATAMILELCGGEAGTPVVAGAVPPPRPAIAFDPARVTALGGVDVPAAEQRRILEGLGCTLSGDQVTPPSWRPDIEGSADLVEEVLRVAGYDSIPAVSLPRADAVAGRAVEPSLARRIAARRVLAGRGLDEAVTWSFLPSAQAALFGGGGADLRLVNPISADLDQMRPSALPNLAAAAGRNAARGFPDVALFEVGPAYRDARPGLGQEGGQDFVAAGIRAGAALGIGWAEKARPVDAFDAKADLLALLEALGAPVANLQTSGPGPAWFHPGQSGQLRLGATVLGQFGLLHPSVLASMGVAGPIAAFECWLDRIPAPRRTGTARPALALPVLQPVRRDFAFLVAAEIEAERVLRAVRAADKALIADAVLFDVYTGPGVPEGDKSLAVAVIVQPREATLTEAELDALAARIVAAVAKQTGARLRS